jgi:hypothetical protein
LSQNSKNLKNAIKKVPFIGGLVAKTYRKLSPSPPQPTPKPLYEMNGTTVTVNDTENSGVFSSYTIRLEAILDYYRTYNRLPSIVDSSQQFTAYKDDLNEDVSNNFFEDYEKVQFRDARLQPSPKPVVDGSSATEHGQRRLFCSTRPLHRHSDGPHGSVNEEAIYLTSEKAEQQFSDYSKLNFLEIRSFIEKYFMPPENIRERIKHFESKMPWDYQSICGIRYRGTDKNLETNQPPYAEIILKAVKLKYKFPHIKFLLQTDERDFLDYAIRELGDECYSHPITSSSKLESIIDYVAAIFILSRCKYLITTSGNGELWARILRGDNRGSIQWLSPKEYIYDIKNESFDPNKKCFWIDSDRIIS